MTLYFWDAERIDTEPMSIFNSMAFYIYGLVDIWKILPYNVRRSYSRVEKCCNCSKFYHIIALALYSAMLPSSLYIGQHYKLPTQCDETKFHLEKMQNDFLIWSTST